MVMSRWVVLLRTQKHSFELKDKEKVTHSYSKDCLPWPIALQQLAILALIKMDHRYSYVQYCCLRDKQIFDRIHRYNHVNEHF